MNLLADIYSAGDALKRRAKDFVSNPAEYTNALVDAMRNAQRGQEAVASPSDIGMREIPREEQTRRMVEGATDTLAGGLGVVKPKGGNWLSGRFAPNKQFEHLRRNPENIVVPAGPNGVERTEAAKQNVTALNSFIDRQLTKYIKNDLAAPTDPVRLMLEKFPEEKAAKLAEANARVEVLRRKQEAQAATRGVPQEYLTRTRQDVLAAEAARDLIEANTGLHVSPEELQRFNPEAVLRARERAGMPIKAIGATPEARAWENYADTAIGTRSAADFSTPDNLNADPWLAKVDPNTPVHFSMHNPVQSFHLVDELRNSLAEGRLTPEQVQKMPIEQAVRHVAEINALRTVEAAKARRMEMEGMPVYRDYPEQGLSWRQLKSEDKDQLSKWLKQEGDAMGHCVGGYCEDVASGQSNIYSLRDDKGKPYATIETGPLEQNIWDNDAEAQQIWDRAYDELTDAGYDPGTPRFETLLYDLLAEREAAWQAAHVDTKQQVIRQIKGPGNASPDSKYFPQIQDFIRSGKWSAVQDAAHTGLSDAEINEILKGQQ